MSFLGRGGGTSSRFLGVRAFDKARFREDSSFLEEATDLTGDL